MRNIRALAGPNVAEAREVLDSVGRDESGKRPRHQTTDLATSRATMAKAVI